MDILRDLERLASNFRQMYTKEILEDRKIDYRCMLLKYDDGVKSIIRKYQTLNREKPYVQTDIYDIMDTIGE